MLSFVLCVLLIYVIVELVVVVEWIVIVLKGMKEI